MSPPFPGPNPPLSDVRASSNVTAHGLGLEGPFLLEVRRFGDLRGYFMETYNEANLRAVGVDVAFVQDNHSRRCCTNLAGSGE